MHVVLVLGWFGFVLVGFEGCGIHEQYSLLILRCTVNGQRCSIRFGNVGRNGKGRDGGDKACEDWKGKEMRLRRGEVEEG